MKLYVWKSLRDNGLLLEREEGKKKLSVSFSLVCTLHSVRMGGDG